MRASVDCNMALEIQFLLAKFYSVAVYLKKVKLFGSNSILNKRIVILYQLLHVTFLLICYFLGVLLSPFSSAHHESIISINAQLLHTAGILDLSSGICRTPTSDIVIRLSVFLGMTCLLNRQQLILFRRIRFQFGSWIDASESTAIQHLYLFSTEVENDFPRMLIGDILGSILSYCEF